MGWDRSSSPIGEAVPKGAWQTHVQLRSPGGTVTFNCCTKNGLDSFFSIIVTDVLCYTRTNLHVQ